MLVYSLLSIVREGKNKLEDWDNYGRDTTYTRYGQTCSTRHFNAPKVSDEYSSIVSPNGEKVEVFSVEKPKERTYEQELVHYPSLKEGREKVKELEKSYWFRAKRSLCGAVGIDITGKYFKPTVTKKKYTVNKSYNNSNNNNDYSRYAPNNNAIYVSDWEAEEYNKVTRLMSRSCEISLLTKENEKNDDPANDAT